LKISQNHFGNEFWTTLRAQKSLATLESKSGQHTQAIGRIKKVIDTHKTYRPEDQINLVSFQAQLGRFYETAGRPNEAIKILLPVLKFKNEHFGDTHRSTLETKQNLAAAYLKIYKHHNAIELNEDVLAVLEKKFDDNHPAILATANSLAISYLQTGQLKRAVAMQEKTLEGNINTHGESDIRTMIAMLNLGRGYWQIKEYEKSIGHLEKCWALARKKMSEKHRVPQTAKAQLAISLIDSGKVDSGLKLLEAVVKDNFGQRQFRWARDALLERCVSHKNSEAAARLLSSEIKQARLKLDKNSTSYADVLLIYAEKLIQCSAYENAKPWVEEAQSIYEKSKPSDWQLANANSMLGEILIYQKDFEQASETLTQAYRDLRQREADIPARIRPRVLASMLKRLMLLAEKTDDSAAAKKWSEVLEKLNSKKN
jgi:tetratricopeptide (TPR) repeat protein